MAWPNDADGDVFRRLSESGFDFSRTVTTDYNVDFKDWPPKPEALHALHAMYGELELHQPRGNCKGYVQFQIHGHLTYETVMAVQQMATNSMENYGGVCESWGVFE